MTSNVLILLWIAAFKFSYIVPDGRDLFTMIFCNTTHLIHTLNFIQITELILGVIGSLVNSFSTLVLLLFLVQVTGFCSSMRGVRNMTPTVHKSQEKP